MENSLLRIGVFYDGSYFSYAQLHYYKNTNNGWLHFQPLHSLLEQIIQSKEQGYRNYKTVYSSWFQGLRHSEQSEDKYLTLERNRHIDLLNAGVDLKLFPTGQNQSEKGIDVYMGLEVLQVALDGKMDIAVLITGDGDFIPLVRALMKNGVRVLLLYFDYENEKGKQYGNPKLIDVCNYSISFGEIESNRDFKEQFKGLFRKSNANKS